MRNVAQYPIQSDEVIEALDDAYEELQEKYKEIFGGVTTYAMYLACEFVREEEEALRLFLERRNKELTNGKS